MHLFIHRFIIIVLFCYMVSHLKALSAPTYAVHLDIISTDFSTLKRKTRIAHIAKDRHTMLSVSAGSSGIFSCYLLVPEWWWFCPGRRLCTWFNSRKSRFSTHKLSCWLNCLPRPGCALWCVVIELYFGYYDLAPVSGIITEVPMISASCVYYEIAA